MVNTSYSVPYVRLDQASSEIKEELMAAFETVLDSGQYILGPQVSAFEEEFARRCQVKYATGVASGTCSLHLVLQGIGLSEGDEVITVPNSFIATASTIALVGAKPVFIDIQSDLNMDPERFAEAITLNTKAVLPVHFTGKMSNIARIMEIADQHGIIVVEDAAQSLGSYYPDKQHIGSKGSIGSFSFSMPKISLTFSSNLLICITHRIVSFTICKR